MSFRVPLVRAVNTASRPFSYDNELRIERSLEKTCGSKAEAFKLGAEHAQKEIVRRLVALEPKGDGGK